MIPRDPIMLLSYLNMQLRDHYSSLEEMEEGLDGDAGEWMKTLSGAGFVYDPELNRFRRQD